MYNDDEKKIVEDTNGETPSSDNAHTTHDKLENERGANDQTSPAEPTLGYKEKPSPYYEPWQQPVYRDTQVSRQEPFTPGLHNGAYNDYQRMQPAAPQPEKKKRRGARGFFKAVCLVLVCALAGGVASYAVVRYNIDNGLLNPVNQVVIGSEQTAEPDASPGGTSDIEVTANPSTSTDMTSSGVAMSAEDIYSIAINQVVGVNSQAETNVFGQTTTSAVSGSGFILSTDGYIATNYHVISYAATQGYSLTVILHDGQSYPAEIVGYEQDNDLAVIKINATDLSAVAIGNTNNVKVGDDIYAVGNPLGELDYTMTSGIVSALDRIIHVDTSISINMFQIDAAVNSGNSGGPVYNANGEVIGIVSAKYASTGVEGLGFAIPINDATDIISQIITNGYVTGKPTMGITIKTFTSAAAEYYDLAEGAYVDSVQAGSAADKAGIKVGDIITKLGDADITMMEELISAKKDFKAGETTTLVVFRDGDSVTLTITFGEEGITATSSQSGAPNISQLPNQSGAAIGEVS